MKNHRIALAAGALALLIGGVGPWATALGVVSIGPSSSGEVSAIVFGGAAFVVLAAALGHKLRVVSIIVGTAAVIEAVYAMVRVQQIKNEAGEFGSLISPGWGLFVTALAGAFLVVSTFVVKRADDEVLA
jgi:hypothetical protein